MNKLIAAVTPGIRAKLSFFTAFFVIIIISIVSALYLNQEFKTLTQSLDREIQPLRKYTERIVLDLENISSSLLLIEDFRFRLKSKQKELKQYKKKIVRVVEEKSWFTKNVLGKLNVIQKDLINTRDKKRVWTFDTFYSEYITDKKINEIEDNIRSQMRDEKGNIISKEKFAYIQKFAHKAEEYRKKLEEQEQKINEYNSEKVEKNEKGEKVTDPKILSKNKEIDKKIEKVTKELNLTKIRMEESIRDLNSEILKFFYQGQRNSIKELALNTDLIRIQTFNIK
ncbi:MAG: hypothetical protein KDK36_16235, partial [Leptospiraceae bacterium]|nr:hypothetical protein [Leptospiraceae bacterium]